MSAYEPDPHTHARRDNPATSHAAAASLGSTKSMARALLHTYADADRTAEEAARLCGFVPERANKRVSDLLQHGLIADTGEVRPGTSGRDQMVCRITMAGWRELL